MDVSVSRVALPPCSSQDEAQCHCDDHQQNVYNNNNNNHNSSNTNKDSQNRSSNCCCHRRIKYDRKSRKSWSIMPGGLVTIATVVFALSLTSHLFLGNIGVGAWSCAPCDLELCSKPTDCAGGLVLDICMCCQVCAHIVNQSCGGSYGYLGKCAQDLHCFYPQEPITGDEIGICSELPSFDCNETDCPSVTHDLCPTDSALHTADVPAREVKHQSDDPFHQQYPDNVDDERSSNGFLDNESLISDVDDGERDVTSHKSDYSPESLILLSGDTSSNTLASTYDLENSAEDSQEDSQEEGVSGQGAGFGPESSAYCVCNMSTCHAPVCAEGYTPHRVRNGTGTPGSCCDVFQCQAIVDCQKVICPPYKEKQCPDDSLLKASIWTDDGCCELQQGCRCPPVNECDPVWCPGGFQVQVLSRASRMPGSCCDRFRCVNETGLTCIYNGKEMRKGQTWVDKCRTCVCKDGVNLCKNKACPRLSCDISVRPKGECCSVCQGCVSESNELYNNSAVWKENDCTTCTCVEGHAECRAERCAVSCQKPPTKVPGQCCPVCDNDLPGKGSTMVTEITPCLNLDGCSLSCPLAQDEHGCSICQCKKEVCNLECEYGLKTDVEGSPVCECSSPDVMCAHWEQTKCDKKCEYGYKKDREGCPKCKCNKCPLFNCSKRCVHGHIVNDEGCTVCKCKDLPVPDIRKPKPELVNSEGKSCMSRLGTRHGNGESWNDGCRVCYCHNGAEMCSLISCPAPHCLYPIYRVGDCCPSCPGVSINTPKGEKEMCQSSQGHYYVEGETWQLDECTHCVCHGSSILCQTPSCPPVLCHHPVKPENECCAVCRGKDLNTLPSSIFPKHCRTTTGMHYKHGESWQSTPCQSCVCQNGQIHCFNQMCPLVNCQKTLLRKGQCCPTCDDTEKPKVCTYNGIMFDDGEKWEGDNCTQCVCLEGKTECFPLVCPVLNCTVMVQRKGHCCPICFEYQSPNKQFTRSQIEIITNKPPDRSDDDMNIWIILFIVMAVIVVVLIVGFIVWHRKSKFKSANIEQQTKMLPPVPTKNSNVESNKFLGILPIEKNDRASNDYTEMYYDHRGKETMTNGLFLNMNT